MPPRSSGTLPLPLCVGFGEAAQLAAKGLAEEGARIQALSAPLRTSLQDQTQVYQINGSLEHRVPHNFNISFLGQTREAMLKKMAGFSLSSGSACSAADIEPSYVLQSLGIEPEQAKASLRISIGRFTTKQEIQHLIAALEPKVSE